MCGDDKAIEFNLREIIDESERGEEEYKPHILAVAKALR